MTKFTFFILMLFNMTTCHIDKEEKTPVESKFDSMYVNEHAFIVTGAKKLIVTDVLSEKEYKEVTALIFCNEVDAIFGCAYNPIPRYQEQLKKLDETLGKSKEMHQWYKEHPTSPFWEAPDYKGGKPEYVKEYY